MKRIYANDDWDDDDDILQYDISIGIEVEGGFDVAQDILSELENKINRVAEDTPGVTVVVPADAYDGVF